MDWLGTKIAVDGNDTKVKDDAFSIGIDENNNYILNVYIADCISNNEENIKEILEKTYKAGSGFAEQLLKKKLGNYSLSEREEQLAFHFQFVLNQNFDILEFNINKEIIDLDGEYTRDEVLDDIREGALMSDYFYLANDIACGLYSKYGNDWDFDKNEMLPFPTIFLDITNKTLERILEAKDLPIIYNIYNDSHDPMDYYYAAKLPDDETVHFAKFTAPLRMPENLINLFILNKFVLGKDKNNFDEIERVKRELDNYMRVSNANNYFQFENRGGKK